MKRYLTSDHIDIKRILLIIVATAMPFIVPAVLVAISGHSIFNIIPYYVGGDAVARYDYVRNIIEHGHLLGYNGYDFVLAKIPSLGSAWGYFWTFPYLLFGHAFGWNLNSPIMANILFLCLANLVFILLTRCDIKSIIMIIIASCLLYINIDYSVTGMSEPSRYAMAILLTGMLYRTAKYDTSSFFKYLIVPLSIILGASFFILLSAFIIPYCLIVLRKLKPLIGYPVTVFSFLLITWIIKRSNSMFCTPYFQGFNMKKDIAAFKEGFGTGVKTVIETSLNNLRCFTVTALEEPRYQHGQYLWFVGVCWILLLITSLILVLRRYNSDDDKWLLLSAFYILAIFISGYVVLYNDDRTTMMRGINTALCVAVFLFILMDSKKMLALFIALALIWSPLFIKNFMSICNDDFRCLTALDKKELQYRRDIAAEYIKVSEDADPWDNTVAIKFGGKNTAFVVPSGAGKISMHKSDINEKARYVLVGSKESAEKVNDFIDAQLKSGHVLLEQNEYFSILMRAD